MKGDLVVVGEQGLKGSRVSRGSRGEETLGW